MTIGATSLQSGRFLFSGHEDSQVLVWDLLSKDVVTKPVHTLTGHHERVTCLQINPQGTTLATGSWDNDLQVCACCCVHGYKVNVI